MTFVSSAEGADSVKAGKGRCGMSQSMGFPNATGLPGTLLVRTYQVVWLSHSCYLSSCSRDTPAPSLISFWRKPFLL